MNTKAIRVYHLNTGDVYLNISQKERESKVVTTSALQVLEGSLRSNQNVGRKIEGRMVYL